MAVTVTYSAFAIGGDPSGDFQTNGFETDNQLRPDVLALSGGGFVCAYNNSSDVDGYVFLSFFGANRGLIGDQVAYVDIHTDAQGQPKLTELNNGNVVVVWDDNNPTDGDAGPQGSIFTPDGLVVSVDINLLGVDSPSYFDLDVAALANGGFVLSYIAFGDAWFQRFNAAGAMQGGAVRADTTGAAVDFDTQVTVLSDGAIAMAWTYAGAEAHIKTRIFEANGAPRTGEIVASAAGSGDNTAPAIAALQDGGYALVYKDTGWDETGVSGDPGISMSIVSSAGVVSSPIHVNTAHFGEESDPDVTVLANGFFAVTWTYPFSPTDRDIYCRVFDQYGVAVTDQFEISDSSDDEVASAVSAMLGGLFITSWQDETTDGNFGSISSQVTEITRTVLGDGAADIYLGDELRDSMFGAGGDDTLFGMGGDDTIDGGGGIDSIDGSSGNDLLQGGGGDDTVYGGLGNDRIYAGTVADPHSSLDGALMYGDTGVDRIRGAGGADTVFGGTQDDKITGGGGADDIDGGAERDKLKGSSGDDTIKGGAGRDTVNGGVGDDVLYAMTGANVGGSPDGDGLNGANGHDLMFGSGGADDIVGLAGKDTMSGGAGADTLSGGSGKDVITGGAGADRMTGGGDKDRFDFNALAESANGAPDLITDLGNLDVIDLSSIDAKAGSVADQAFTLVAAFTGEKGELVVAYHATGTYAGLTTIQGDVDGDGGADFTITATGDRHVFDNFVL